MFPGEYVKFQVIQYSCCGWLCGGGGGLCKRIKMFFEKRQDTESHLSLSADCFNLKGVEKAIANLIKLEVCHRIGPSNTEVY